MVRLHTLFRHDWPPFASFIALSALVKHAFIGSRKLIHPSAGGCPARVSPSVVSLGDDRISRTMDISFSWAYLLKKPFALQPLPGGTAILPRERERERENGDNTSGNDYRDS